MNYVKRFGGYLKSVKEANDRERLETAEILRSAFSRHGGEVRRPTSPNGRSRNLEGPKSRSRATSAKKHRYHHRGRAEHALHGSHKKPRRRHRESVEPTYTVMDDEAVRWWKDRERRRYARATGPRSRTKSPTSTRAKRMVDSMESLIIAEGPKARSHSRGTLRSIPPRSRAPTPDIVVTPPARGHDNKTRSELGDVPNNPASVGSVGSVSSWRNTSDEDSNSGQDDENPENSRRARSKAGSSPRDGFKNHVYREGAPTERRQASVASANQERRRTERRTSGRTHLPFTDKTELSEQRMMFDLGAESGENMSSSEEGSMGNGRRHTSVVRSRDRPGSRRMGESRSSERSLRSDLRALNSPSWSFGPTQR